MGHGAAILRQLKSLFHLLSEQLQCSKRDIRNRFESRYLLSKVAHTVPLKTDQFLKGSSMAQGFRVSPQNVSVWLILFHTDSQWLTPLCTSI